MWENRDFRGYDSANRLSGNGLAYESLSGFFSSGILWWRRRGWGAYWWKIYQYPDTLCFQRLDETWICTCIFSRIQQKVRGVRPCIRTKAEVTLCLWVQTLFFLTDNYAGVDRRYGWRRYWQERTWIYPTRSDKQYICQGV